MSQPPQYPDYPAYPQYPGDAPTGGYSPPGYPVRGYGPPGYGPPGYGPGGYPPPSYPPPSYLPPAPPPFGYGPGGYPPPGFTGPSNRKFDIGDAFRWSMHKFGRNAAALIVPSLGYAAAAGAVIGALTLVFAGLDGSGRAAAPGLQFLVVMLGYLAAPMIAAMAQAAYLSGCLDIADGKPVTIGSFFGPRNVGAALTTAALVGLLVAASAMLLVIPALIAAFFTQFAVAFALDRSLAPIDALKASFTTCTANIGDTLLSWLAQMALLVAGQLLCGVGLLITFPLAVLIQTYTYRRLTGGWLAPIQP